MTATTSSNASTLPINKHKRSAMVAGSVGLLIAGAILGAIGQYYTTRWIAREFQQLEKMEEVHAAIHGFQHAVDDLDKMNAGILKDLQHVARTLHEALTKASLYSTTDCRNHISNLKTRCMAFCKCCNKIKEELERSDGEPQAVDAMLGAKTTTAVATIKEEWKKFDKDVETVLSLLCKDAGLTPLSRKQQP